MTDQRVSTGVRTPGARWRLHRGGIVNVWQYAEQTFDFSGGRAIFQGTNGSGKSRTLELLLPLCLDGDLRHLGSKGFDTVSIRRLMLDEYDGGPNRIGYAWIELHRDGPAGEEYLTCGIGVKASKTSQQITDSWRFITESRIGVDVQLVGADRVPFGPVQLREAIGADCVLEEPVFRARIAEIVYGMPTARYADLLHLQRTLRNPDVGLKVLEGQLEQILSDALPPLDTSLVEQLATSFDDLESIRENISRLRTADRALGTFLASYTDYALAGLRTAAEKAAAAEDALRKGREEARKLAGRLESATAQRAEAQHAVAEREAEEQRVEARIEALKELPAYRGLQDLQDRERLVAAARSAATAALEVASKQRAAEDAAVDGVLRPLRRLDDDLGAARGLAEPLRAALRAAGLDTGLVPALPDAPGGEPSTVVDRVHAKPDPEAEPLTIERRLPPTVDTDTLLAILDEAAERAGAAGHEARRRRALLLALHQRATEAEHERHDVEELRRAVRQAQFDATEAAGLRNQAVQDLHAVAETWIDRVQEWNGTGPLAQPEAPQPPEPPTVEELVADRSAARTAAQVTRQWAVPHVQAVREVAQAAQRRRTELAGLIGDRDAELAALRSGAQSVPSRHPYGSAERDHADGAPFYRLVDFAPALGDAERAGLEAALQASGLLDAWVTREGRVADPDLADVLAVPAAGSGHDSSLADALVPAPEPGCPVPAAVVADLLASVALADEPHAAGGGMAVSVRGRWRAGTLAGAWRKESAEFVGAGAREAARQRRIAELEQGLADLRGDLAGAEEELAATRELLVAWERHVECYPDDEEPIAAHARVAGTEEAAERARRRVAELRERHDEAERRWQARHAELVRDAAAAGLPAEVDALRVAEQAAAEVERDAAALGEALRQRCRGTVEDLVDAVHRYHAAVADREDAERTAGERCAEYADRAARLEQLTAAVGGEAQQIAEQLAGLEQDRRRLRDELRAARERVTERREQAVKLETLLETRNAQLAERETAAREATEAFRAAVAAPGVLAAALPESEVDSDDLAAARAAVRAAGSRNGASESTVLGRLQALQTSLSGSHDISAERHAGLLTVLVTGEEGPRPVAETARRVSERLATQRGYLNEQYQRVFADYLIRDLAERLRAQIAVAEDLCRRMNGVLDHARSSQGVHVQLEWEPSAALDEQTREALTLVRMPFADRTAEQDATLRRAFTERIEAERDANSASYPEILARALDYRAWHTFTVRVRDTGPDGKPRVRRLRQLSSGETRLVSYVTLFAAAASFYDAVGTGSEGVDPLRLVLLDEAFERLDDPTVARMLGLLVELDMDWIITWPSGWGVSSKIPRMHIYDVLRPKSGRGVACTHTTWDGAALARDDP
ncbi:TIGR02680 family protein [Gandjariella thermophila]|uniref:TIGR02680 family protein n=1 Tax=Gandjariella thermophila TaxID=1931992 RepID=A0A4D4J8W9_9PSEU|nr:TIGR02680 family protein [Gandjariella thermophila]GDY33111.1 hypothetical protein GTS_47440 [Gandjariella thermophila]